MMGLAREAVNLKNTRIYFTFRGPCIVIYSYNKSQQDALFLNFIFIYNFTCFGQTYCPSSGDLILYSQQLVFSYYLCWLFASEVEMFWTDLLSIIRSLNTVFTAIDICHTIYVYSLLVRSSSISTSLAVNTVYNIKAFG